MDPAQELANILAEQRRCRDWLACNPDKRDTSEWRGTVLGLSDWSWAEIVYYARHPWLLDRAKQEAENATRKS